MYQNYTDKNRELFHLAAQIVQENNGRMPPMAFASGFTYIAGGCYASVYKHPSLKGKVIKIGEDAERDGWLKYATHCYEAYLNDDWMPERLAVYDLQVHGTWYIALIEKLDCTVTDVRSEQYPMSPLATSFSAEVLSALQTLGLLEDYTVYFPRVDYSMYAEEVARSVSAGFTQIAKACGRFTDLHSSNMMVQHKTGRIVVTDPYFGISEEEMQEVMQELRKLHIRALKEKAAA